MLHSYSTHPTPENILRIKLPSTLAVSFKIGATKTNGFMYHIFFSNIHSVDQRQISQDTYHENILLQNYKKNSGNTQKFWLEFQEQVQGQDRKYAACRLSGQVPQENECNAEMVAYFKQHAFEHVEAFLKEKEVNVCVLCLPNYIKFLLTPT